MTVKNSTQAEEFLRLSQRELQISLNNIKREFLTASRKLAEETRAKRYKALREDFRRLNLTVPLELREEALQDLESQTLDIPCVAFDQIKNCVSFSLIICDNGLTSKQINTKLSRQRRNVAFKSKEERIAGTPSSKLGYETKLEVQGAESPKNNRSFVSRFTE